MVEIVGKQDKIDGIEESEGLLWGRRELEQLMFLDWSNYNIFKGIDHNKRLCYFFSFFLPRIESILNLESFLCEELHGGVRCFNVELKRIG